MPTSGDVVDLDLGAPEGREAGFRHPAVVVTAAAHPRCVTVSDSRRAVDLDNSAVPLRDRARPRRRQRSVCRVRGAVPARPVGVSASGPPRPGKRWRRSVGADPRDDRGAARPSLTRLTRCVGCRLVWTHAPATNAATNATMSGWWPQWLMPVVAPITGGPDRRRTSGVRGRFRRARIGGRAEHLRGGSDRPMRWGTVWCSTNARSRRPTVECRVALDMLTAAIAVG